MYLANTFAGSAVSKSSFRRVAVGNVVALGAVSMCTDISSEMVTAVLPAYLVLGLHLSLAQYGFLDGLYTGATALTRLLGGWLADRYNQRKLTAAAGYGLSAAAKIGLLLAGTPAGISVVLAVDRTGKGIRTAPRDAMIAQSVDERDLGQAFGLHRTMDNVGAFLGPLAALGLLLLAGTSDYDTVFLGSLCVAVLGLVVLAVFVQNRRGGERREPVTRAQLRQLMRTSTFGRLCVAAALLGVVTVGDGFVFLALQRRDALPPTSFPLLAVGTSLGFILLALPAGRLADRIGRWPVIAAGYICLLAVYLLLSTGRGSVLVILALYGAFYAATDGVLPALAAPLIPDGLKTSGLAVLQTGQALAYFASSVAFGSAWQYVGLTVAAGIAAAAAALVLPVCAVIVRAHQLGPPRVNRLRSDLITKLMVVLAAVIVLVTIPVVWALTRPGPSPVIVDNTITLRSPGLLVRDTTTGRIALIRGDGQRTQSAIACSRTYTAAGVGVCLQTDPDNPTGFRAAVLDQNLNVTRFFPLNGLPTRSRVAADGNLVAWTIFVTGDSYASTAFSTRTGILDLQSGRLLDSLENLTLPGGHALAVDANFWGVTFLGDDNTFYATMATSGHHYLVRGDLAAKTVTVVTDGMECPSISPDENRLVYKSRLADNTWRLWVYDLATGNRTQLAETENVDDQGAWADDSRIMYGKPNPATGQVDLWSVPADGTGTPTKIAADAESPAFIKEAS